MSLGDYQITYSGNPYGTNPAPATFAQLGVTAAKVVVQAGGIDYADITVDATLGAPGSPFLPFARHDLRNPQGVLVFSGWLTKPSWRATANRHQRTFRLDGPMSRLDNIMYRQQWNLATDPGDYGSPTTATGLAAVILNLEDFLSGTRKSARAQIQDLLSYAIGHGAPVAFVTTAAPGNLLAIPDVHPPEDEQRDITVATALKREMRWVPKVAARWEYASGTPTLAFSAADPASAADVLAAVGGPALPVGTAYQVLPGGDAVVIDVLARRLTNFQSDARYDQLVGVLHLDYMTEQSASSEEGADRLWIKAASDVSPPGGVATNGSPREMVMTLQLRGASLMLDDSGQPLVPNEQIPTNLAAALHAPYAVLTHDTSWSTAGQDVEWETRPGMAVSVLNAGDAHPVDARSILQTITRDLATGTTSYEAGVPGQLGLADLLAIYRVNDTRNQGRGGNTQSGGYNQGGGPAGQQFGFKQPDQGSGGNGSGSGSGGGNTAPPGDCSTDHKANESRANNFVWPCTGAGGTKYAQLGVDGEPTLVWSVRTATPCAWT